MAPVIAALSNWGREHGPAPEPDDAVSFRWLLLLFRRQYVRSGGRWIVQLDCGEKSLQLRLGGSEFEGVEGAPMRPDLVIRADASAWYALLFGDETATELVEAGRITLEPGSSGEDPQPVWQDFVTSLRL